MTTLHKKCTKCHQTKDRLNDFYFCKGVTKSECKACTIRRNVKNQRKNKSWERTEVDPETRRQYMRSYYAKNKSKFAKYRADFKKRFPNYYTNYFRKLKEAS